MATSIVVESLIMNENYRNWRVCMKSYLLSQDLWKVVEDPAGKKVADFKQKDAAALHAIQISCSPKTLALISSITTAKGAWDALASWNNWPRPEPKERTTDDERAQVVALFKAITVGDLDSVKTLLRDRPNLINAKLFTSVYGDGSALQLAIYCNQPKVVEELVSKMSDPEMNIVNKELMLPWALFNAAYNGSIEIADYLIEKNENILETGYSLEAACWAGNGDMIYHLYPRVITKLSESRTSSLPLDLIIYGGWFDIAFDIIDRLDNKWIISKAFGGLICEPAPFPSAVRLPSWKRWIYSCLTVNLPTALKLKQEQNEKKNTIMPEQSSGWAVLLKFLGIKQIYDLKVTHAYAQKLLHLLSTTIPASRFGLDDVIIAAARLGITEIIVEIIRENPDLLWCTDNDGRTIFDIAIIHRQEKVFSLIYGTGALKKTFTVADDTINRMLHMAGESAPQRLVDQIQGPALLMQRELQWFQEVKSISSWTIGVSQYGEDNSPYEVFDENHKELVKQGEKWMKDIAQSSTVIGTLIITVMFAILFTLPGGNNPDTGIPLFLPRKAFKLFIVSDAISLFAASTSVLMFLGILTSRFAAKDFLKSLPTKLIIALFSLFISTATMMIAFCSAVFLVLKGQLWFVVPIILLASIPISVFVFSQFPLLITLFKSTYIPRLFDRKMKNWLLESDE